MAETLQIRDLINPNAVIALADRIKLAYPGFDHASFVQSINPFLSSNTYSERINLVTESLAQHLPDNFPAAAKILLHSQLPPYATDELGDANERFITVTNTRYISQYGMEHFKESMSALYEMTKRLTAEWDIRPFIEKYPKDSMSLLKKWTKDKNPHVRRLVSEGTRPFLPWGKRLHHFKDHPEETLFLLKELFNDESAYVRRSVANHLNDHSKNHGDLVVETLNKWKNQKGDKNSDKLIKHATRTLVKKGHAGALALIGFKKGAKVEIKNFSTSKNIAIGEYLEFKFDLCSAHKETQKIMIDYIIYFKKADQSLSPKVFKLTVKNLKANEQISIVKKHSFKIITTRKYYVGEHKIAVQVNGEERFKKSFQLTSVK